MKILCVGDVTSPAGVEHLRTHLWQFRRENKIDFCVVNGENASLISAATPETLRTCIHSTSEKACPTVTIEIKTSAKVLIVLTKAAFHQFLFPSLSIVHYSSLNTKLRSLIDPLNLLPVSDPAVISTRL